MKRKGKMLKRMMTLAVIMLLTVGTAVYAAGFTDNFTGGIDGKTLDPYWTSGEMSGSEGAYTYSFNNSLIVSPTASVTIAPYFLHTFDGPVYGRFSVDIYLDAKNLDNMGAMLSTMTKDGFEFLCGTAYTVYQDASYKVFTGYGDVKTLEFLDDDPSWHTYWLDASGSGVRMGVDDVVKSTSDYSGGVSAFALVSTLFSPPVGDSPTAQYRNFSFTEAASPVPEASTLVGFGSALAMVGPGLGGWLKRRRQ